MSALTAALLTERPRPERIRSRPGAWRLAVLTVCFGAFMGQLDASIVTLAYGGLRTGFHTSLAAVQWVSLSYLLALVALLVPVGRLSDTLGRKLFYLHGFAVFTIASAACGLAPGLGVLIGCRVVQAAGAAMMQANSVALVTTCAPAGRARSALGLQAAAQALGLALGPTAGGALVSGLGWRWVFLVNVPVGVAGWIAGRYLLPRTRARTAAPPGRPDLAGVLLLGLAATTALLALSAASGLPVPGWGTALLAAAAVAATAAFTVRQRRAARPLLDPAQLRRPGVRPGLLGALGGYLVLFGPLVLVPEVLIAHGGHPLAAGATLTALPAGFALAGTAADRLLPRATSDRARLLLGAGIATAGCAVLTAVLAAATGPSPVLLAAALGLLGLGLGVFTPANNSLVMAAFPPGGSGTAGGLVNMARGLGTSLGVAAVTLSLHVSTAVGAAWVLVAVCGGVTVVGALRRGDRG